VPDLAITRRPQAAARLELPRATQSHRPGPATAKASAPDYGLIAHTASLGHGAFIGQHGWWNRKPPRRYKATFAPFDNVKPGDAQRNVLTGSLDDGGNARGRPVGVALDCKGALQLADDVGNVISRVLPAAKRRRALPSQRLRRHDAPGGMTPASRRGKPRQRECVQFRW
jgi:hypothetical protein